MKTFNQAPLPFQGQKRRFLKHFKEALKDFPEDAIYVDLFRWFGAIEPRRETSISQCQSDLE